MAKHDDDNDQTSTRIKLMDRTRVLKGGRSVVMVAWNVGAWKRSLRFVAFIVAVILGFFLWKSFQKHPAVEKPMDAANNSESAGAPRDVAPTKGEGGSVNYLAQGRGLVYNCGNRRWYCVDSANYRRCRTQMKAQQGDCVVRSVFNTDQLCQSDIAGRKSEEMDGFCPRP
ncbi:MAG: hypothetical protein QE271_01880 [Bacteriovoracaceae bacterium]|nr:hypothetical protein [Bacteriovoracaceae bacterium]